MPKKIFIQIIFIFLIKFCFSNNVRITSVPTLVNPSPINKTVYIDFNMSWDNSWRNSTNYDAVWLFAKYKKNNGAWEHAYLDITESNHSVTNENGTASQFEVGINNISGIDRGLGVYAYRAGNGSGDINWENVHLKWNYGENGVSNNDSVVIQVFAIEMVYVPQGAFWIGDGASFSRFHQGNNQNAPFQVTGQPITFGTTAGALWATDSWLSTSTGLLNANYPTGYNAFYCMKYGITQQQYVDFLNSLTRIQQNERTATDLSATVTSVTNVFVMSATSAPSYRNGIRCNNTIAANSPVTFYCDLNNNGTMNQSDDGQYIACNYLSWADGVAYGAWAGLRPLTEPEYEKACRGDSNPVSGEYAWGTANITPATSITSPGATDEKANAGANCVYNNASGVQGPIRVGAFASSTSTRQTSGATAYGIMEMSGNLWGRVVSLGSAAGRTFTGINGNGQLNAQGNATLSNWPGTNAVGSGLRGNHWKGTAVNGKISARDNGNYESAIRNEMFGFRLVRGQ